MYYCKSIHTITFLKVMSLWNFTAQVSFSLDLMDPCEGQEKELLAVKNVDGTHVPKTKNL